MLRIVLLVLLCLSSWGASQQDALIAAKLKQKLAHSKLKADGLQFRVDNGVVEWSGAVKIPQRKGAATRIAKSAGAKRVVNRIVVQGGEAGAKAQAQPRKVTVQIPKS